MINYSKALIITLCLTAGSMTAQETPQISELNAVLTEVAIAPLNADGMKTSFEITDYRLVDDHIANLGAAFTIETPKLDVAVNCVCRNASLGDATNPLYQRTTTDAVFVASIISKAGHEGLIEGAHISPISKEEWEQTVALFNIANAGVEAESGLTFVLTPTQEEADGAVKQFKLTITPAPDAETALAMGPVTTEVTFHGDYAETFITVTDPTGDYQIFQEQEEAAIAFLSKLQDRDPATIAMTQGMMQMAKGYCEMLANMPAMMAN